jgi:hypothetical protein
MRKRLVSGLVTLSFVASVCGFGFAQSKNESPAPSNVGWTSYVQFGGSSNADGQIFEINTNVGYIFTKHFGMDAGVPVYFVNASSSAGGVSGDGIGDPYVDLRWRAPNPSVNYAMILTGSVPLGDRSLGLSTGHARFDWTNHFDHSFGSFTPFLEAGLSNSIYDTELFVRPYVSQGMNAHFLGGARIAVRKPFSVGGSLYDIDPFGSQTVFSRVTPGPPNIAAGQHGRGFANTQQSSGTSALDRDNGFSIFAIYSPNPVVDAQLGYTRSVHYDLNTFSFSLGFNLGRLLRNQY